ncbi:MAG: sugar phosphate isomerase/epimerase family protein [Anaerolineae bacterium]
MQAGINVWTWGIDSRQQFEQGVKEVADIGYRAVENISSIVRLYEDKPEDFDALMNRYEVEFVCGYHHFSGDFERDYANAERYLKFLAGRGPKVMNLQAGARAAGGVTEAVLAQTAEQAAKIGELGQRYGLRFCLHPHYGTNVERQSELDYVMGQVPESVLGLTIDTAHAVLGGMDPVGLAHQYGGRVGYMHVKDIQPLVAEGAPWYSKFRELGRGIVDFVGVADELGKAGYEGVLCVELDSPRVSGYKSAAISRAYLKDELGL